MSEQTTLLRNPVDAWTGSENPTTNHADSKALWVQSGTNYAWLHFNRPFPLGATIVEATLRLYTKGSWNTTPTITVRRALDRWGVNHVTWNNQPPVSNVLAQLTQSSAGDDDEWAIDVTNLLQQVSDGGVWYGFRVGSDSAQRLAFNSSVAGVGTRPQLEVTWSDAPQPPDTLKPSGGLAVSVGKPLLSFDFTDHRGSTALQAVQVQIDPDGTFGAGAPGAVSAAADWDSGPVTATEPELDLTATTYPGLAAGAETRWRVAVQDGAGMWSDWSDPARFRRDNKGALTILNPGAAPNDFVSEWTPPIIWELTGEVQRAWQVLITPADDHTTHLYDSGKTKGADTSWTLPKGVIEDDSRYRVVVRVWDSKDRVHTSSDDRVYTQAEREFAFREDPTPNPVTNLAVDNLLPRPWAELTWDRATAPDKFAVKRDGRVIESDLDPADLLQSGTTYRWVDKDAHPYRRHTWKVQVTVNGVTSGGPEVSLDLMQQGIWLSDNERDIDVFINGRDEGTWAMGEDATTHNPLGATRGVRITQALRGLEGTITGTITPDAGKSVEDWEDRLLRIKARPGQVCTLSLGNTSLRCVVGNVAVWPLPTVPITKGVSFDFWQVGRLDFKPRL